MSRPFLAAPLFAFFASAVLFPAPTAAQPAPIKPEEELVNKVKVAIERGTEFLRKRQTPQGNWEGLVLTFMADMEGGSTALVTLALLNCGKKPDDPAMAKALDYL